MKFVSGTFYSVSFIHSYRLETIELQTQRKSVRQRRFQRTKIFQFFCLPLIFCTIDWNNIFLEQKCCSSLYFVVLLFFCVCVLKIQTQSGTKSLCFSNQITIITQIDNILSSSWIKFVCLLDNACIMRVLARNIICRSSCLYHFFLNFEL